MFPVASDPSIATLEMGNWFALMVVPPGPFSVTFKKVEAVPEIAAALVVTQTFPPIGLLRLFGTWPVSGCVDYPRAIGVSRSSCGE